MGSCLSQCHNGQAKWLRGMGEAFGSHPSGIINDDLLISVAGTMSSSWPTPMEIPPCSAVFPLWCRAEAVNTLPVMIPMARHTQRRHLAVLPQCSGPRPPTLPASMFAAILTVIHSSAATSSPLRYWAKTTLTCFNMASFTTHCLRGQVRRQWQYTLGTQRHIVRLRQFARHRHHFRRRLAAGFLKITNGIPAQFDTLACLATRKPMAAEPFGTKAVF